eukprot:m51a1_g8119 hypothetical protein (592) ;mRNA; r:149278-151428
MAAPVPAPAAVLKTRMFADNTTSAAIMPRLSLYPADYKPPPLREALAEIRPPLRHAETLWAECTAHAIEAQARGGAAATLALDDAISVFLYTVESSGCARQENLYFRLNRCLADRNPDEIHSWRHVIFYIVRALRCLSPVAGLVFRGVDRPMDPKRYEKTRKIAWNSFTSTTGTEDTAKRFMRENETKEHTFFFINVKRGRSLVGLSPYDEDEILIEPNSEFLVTSYSKFGTATVIHLDELDSTRLLLPLDHVFPDRVLPTVHVAPSKPLPSTPAPLAQHAPHKSVAAGAVAQAPPAPVAQSKSFASSTYAPPYAAGPVVADAQAAAANANRSPPLGSGLAPPTSCAACGQRIVATRYKCYECYDYELCQSCAAGQAATRTHRREHALETLAPGARPGPQPMRAPQATPPAGSVVRRGRDWKWGDQDANGEGTVLGPASAPGWLAVRWASGEAKSYRWGAEAAYDVVVVAAAQAGQAALVAGVSGPRPAFVQGPADAARASYAAPPPNVQPVLASTIPCTSLIGKRVQRGPDWMWGTQGTFEGTVVAVDRVPGWVHVRWDNNDLRKYRWGADSCFDLLIVGVPLIMPRRPC